MNKKQKLLSDLIPITAHYDTSILITKNGELVQILSVNGFSKRFNQNQELKLRSDVKKILKELLSKDVMFYLYVKRDYKDIEISQDFTSEFAKIKHEIWLKNTHLESTLMNTLYIAIVHIGAKMLLSKSAIIHHLSFNRIKNAFMQKLDKCAEEISQISMQILQSLEKYGVDLLSLVERNGQLISEPLSFIYYLIHSKEKEIEVKKVDYAKILSYNLQIKNGYNTSEFITNDGLSLDLEGNLEDLETNIISHHISMLTLKSGYDLPIQYTDQILNLNHRMMITETIKLSTTNTFESHIRGDRKFYELMEFKTALNISDIILQDCDKPMISQISLKIIGNTPKELEINLTNTKNLLQKIGIVFLTEDLYILGSFFGILPGNSFLLRREFMTTANQSCIFSEIQPQSLGRYNGSIWGQPITIFRTTDNLPFFFNFHNQNNIGHTLIIGGIDHGLNILVSLLISESFKLDLRVIDLFSNDQDLAILYNSLNEGQSIDIPSINLAKAVDYQVEEFYKVVEFILFNAQEISLVLKEQICDLFGQLMVHLKNGEKAEDIITIIHDIISIKIMNSDIQNLLIEFFSMDIYFKFFYQELPIQKKFFKSNIDDLIPENKYKIETVAILTFFIMKQISYDVNEENIVPIIINVSSIVLRLTTIYKSDLIQLLNNLAKKHIVVILNCTSRQTLYNLNGITEIIRDQIGVKIFLSDKFIDKEFKTIFNLSHLEINKIKMYAPSERIFLMKQDDYSVTCSFTNL